MTSAPTAPSPDRATFRAPDAQATLEADGWRPLPPLERSTVEGLRAFAASVANCERPGARRPQDAAFTMLHEPEDVRRTTWQVLVREVFDQVAPDLERYRPVIANLIRKDPGGGLVPVHQNWSMVDEGAFRSISLWFALDDVDVHNGALYVVSGSHDRFRSVRGSWGDTKWSGPGCAEHVLEIARPLPCPAGGGFAFDDALVHGSHPNEHHEARVAVQVICVPQEARLLYLTDLSDEIAEVEDVDPTYFFDFWGWRGRSHGARTLGTVPIRKPVYDRADFDAILDGAADAETVLRDGARWPFATSAQPTENLTGEVPRAEP